MMKFTRVLLVACAAFAMTGCLEIESVVTLRQNGSGRIDLTYTIDRDAWDTATFGDTERAGSIPVSREQFEAAAAQLDGLDLRSHRIRVDDDAVYVTARLDFSDPATLIAFLGTDTIEIDLQESGGTWRQTIAPESGVERAEVEALVSTLEPYAITLRLVPPRRVVTSTPGSIAANGSSAEISLSLADIAVARSPVVWTVTW